MILILSSALDMLWVWTTESKDLHGRIYSWIKDIELPTTMAFLNTNSWECLGPNPMINVPFIHVTKPTITNFLTNKFIKHCFASCILCYEVIQLLKPSYKNNENIIKICLFSKFM